MLSTVRTFLKAAPYRGFTVQFLAHAWDIMGNLGTQLVAQWSIQRASMDIIICNFLKFVYCHRCVEHIAGECSKHWTSVP